MSSERIRRNEPVKIDTSMQQHFKSDRDIDEMLDFINSTTNGHRAHRPLYAPQSVDPPLYHTTINNTINTKSNQRIGRSIHEQEEVGNQNDYGGYVPSQLSRKPNYGT